MKKSPERFKGRTWAGRRTISKTWRQDKRNFLDWEREKDWRKANREPKGLDGIPSSRPT